MLAVDSLERFVLIVATALLVVAASVVLWREAGRGAEGGFISGWRDFLGLVVTLGGLAVLLTWLWSTA